MQTETNLLTKPACDPGHWLLDPGVTFLNHGSFGACPKRVLDTQTEWRARFEKRPVQFLVRELEKHWDDARGALAQFVHADTDEVVFAANATSGVNTVLRSLEFQRGDELLVTNQEYNACRNALNYVAERAGAKVVVAETPFPLRGDEDVMGPILEKVNDRTRLTLIDHVTSATALVMPMARLVKELNARNVDTLVDGAHALGMVPLNLKELGAAYYTGNCHKWLCSPKSAALLYVRRDKQSNIRPLTISHGANSRRGDRSRFLLEFGWMGTGDPSAVLSVPEALRFMDSALPGGWPQVMARNHALAVAARRVLCEALRVPEPAPESFIGAMASVPLPDAAPQDGPRLPINEYPLQDALRENHQIEVPIHAWPAPPKRVLRISAQLYNSLPQYELLAQALKRELGK